MKKMAARLSMMFLLVPFFCGAVMAKEYKLNVYMAPQKHKTWCSISVVQAWVGDIKGICFPVSQQDEIAYKTGDSELTLKAASGWGWNAGDVKKALEIWTGKSFEYHNHKDYSSAFSRIKEELKNQQRPLAISANACTPSGAPKTAQKHWMLIEALRLKNDNKDFDGAYIKDPLYASEFASGYEVLRPRTWVRDLFVKWWIPNKSVSTNFRQSVED